MDEVYIDILNNCIDLVEEQLSSHSFEDFPYCRIVLASASPNETKVGCIRGTMSKPAALPTDLSKPNVLVKDADKFAECWEVISGAGQQTKIAMEFKMIPNTVPTIDIMDLRGAYAMPVEIMCRGITKKLSPQAHLRMFGR